MVDNVLPTSFYITEIETYIPFCVLDRWFDNYFQCGRYLFGNKTAQLYRT